MKKHNIALIVLLAIISGCKDAPVTPRPPVQAPPPHDTVAAAPAPPPPDVAAIEKEIKIELARHVAPSQFYSSDSLGGQITGKGGTFIKIVKADLQTKDGKPVTGDVVVELKELTGKRQFAAANAPTVSDGRLLVSGGVYYVGMTSEGQELQLKPGRALTMRLPKAGDGMSVFYGERNNSEIINWKQAGQALTQPTVSNGITRSYKAANGQTYWVKDNEKTASNIARLQNTTAQLKKAGASVSTVATGGDRGWSCFGAGYRMHREDTTELYKLMRMQEDSLSKESMALQQAARLYNEIKVAQLGWINCDRFLDAPEVMPLAYYIPSGSYVSYAKIFVIFNSINSLMEGYYTTGSNENTISRVPVGADVTAIAMTVKDKKVLLSKIRTTTKKGSTIAFDMREASAAEVKNMFQ